MRFIVRRHLRKAVIVTLKSGEAFRGVLFEADPEAIILRSAGLLEATGSDRVPTPVDGELLILRGDVAFMQFV